MESVSTLWKNKSALGKKKAERVAVLETVVDPWLSLMKKVIYGAFNCKLVFEDQMRESGRSHKCL